MLQRTLGILAAVLVSLSLIAAPATAAHPKDGVYQQTKHHGEKLVIGLYFHHGKVTPSFYNKCSRVPVIYKAKVRKSGKFVFKGTKKNVIDEKITIRLKGRFKTKNLAVGTVKYTAKGCTAKKVRFRAKYDAQAGPPTPIVGG
jgi:hypothetical protein